MRQQHSDCLTLTAWQERCFHALRGNRFSILNAPMGSGKSVSISSLIADALHANPTVRAIIAVPQTLIADGFRPVDWHPVKDLCHGVEGNVEELISFLSEPPTQGDINKRVVVCTHATLVRAFAKKQDLFRDLLLWIDEAHHVSHGKTDTGEDVHNSLGRIMRSALEELDLNFSLGLATATFYRGDRVSVVPACHLSGFVRFSLSYEDYIRDLGLTLTNDWIVYENNNWTEAITKRMADAKKTIVYIPPVGSSFSLGSKTRDVEAVLRAIAQSETPVIEDQDCPVMRVRRGDQWIRVLDLVDETLRREKKRALIHAHRSGRDDIDIVIALNMAKEGANWKWAEREIIVGQRSSLTDIIQTIGRLFRKAEGKSHVEVFHLIPFVLEHLNSENLREACNEALKAYLLLMMVDDILQLELPSSRAAESTGDGPLEDTNRPPRVKLTEVTDEDTALSIHKNVLESVIQAIHTNAGLKDDTVALNKKFQEIVANVLQEHGVTHEHEEIAREMWRSFSRQSNKVLGIKVQDIKADLVHLNPFEGLLAFTSQTVGIETFAQLRSAVGQWKNLDENYIVRQYENNGRSSVKIANELGVAIETVTKVLRKYGIALRGGLIDEEYIVTQYVDNGRSSDKIAKELGVAPVSVLKVLRKRGIAIRHRIDEQTKCAVIQQYELGLSYRQIAENTGVPDHSLHPLLKRLGVKLRRPGRKRESKALRLEIDLKIVALTKEGKTGPEIGTILNVNKGRIDGVLRKHGIKRPRHRLRAVSPCTALLISGSRL
jgi:superfamily II DNA or RNA helicase